MRKQFVLPLLWSLATITLSACAMPTPTLTVVSPTAVPTIAPRKVASLFMGEDFIKVVYNGEQIVVPAGETRYLVVKHNEELPESGNFHLLGGTQMTFLSVSDPIFEIGLLPGSDIFVQTGPYANGAEIELAGSSVVTSVRGCMAAYSADNDTLIADCFEGICSFSTDFGAEFTEFGSGQQIKVDISQLQVTNQQSIPEADKLKYYQLLNQTSAGRQDIRRCNVPPPPTPTPKPSPTSTPTPKPSPTPTPTLTPSPTFTPTPLPPATPTTPPSTSTPQTPMPTLSP